MCSFAFPPEGGTGAPRQAVLMGMTDALQDNSFKASSRIGSPPLCQISQSELLSQGHGQGGNT